MWKDSVRNIVVIFLRIFGFYVIRSATVIPNSYQFPCIPEGQENWKAWSLEGMVNHICKFRLMKKGKHDIVIIIVFHKLSILLDYNLCQQ